MNQLNRIYDATLLSRSVVYQIDCCLYNFVGKDPYASIQAPKYQFQPLPGQKRRSELVLNHRQLKAKVYSVEGMKVSDNATATKVGVQLSLF